MTRAGLAPADEDGAGINGPECLNDRLITSLDALPQPTAIMGQGAAALTAARLPFEGIGQGNCILKITE